MCKKTRIPKAALLTFLIFGFASVVKGQTSGRTPPTTTSAAGRIEGRVLLPGGQPADRRIKIVLSTLRDPGMVAYTDTGGYFRYDGLSPGTYSLEAVDDSNKYEKGVERVTINRAERVSIQVYLKDKSPTAEKPKEGVVSAYAGDQNVPGPARREFDKARQLSKDGLTEQAVEHYKEAIRIYPTYLMAHNDLGVQYLAMGRLENAADEFGTAIDIDPKAFNPRLNLGIVLIKQQRLPDALDQLTRAVSLDSSQAAGHFYVGVASLGADDLDVAERELSKALELGGPQYLVAHFHLAGVHLKRGDRERAIHELETYLAASPGGDQGNQAQQLLERIKHQ